METIRWGILATGNIAAKLAEAINEVEDAQLVAAASRSLERADAFANQWDIPKRYGSYQELADDPEVDVVYIATPHSHHAECMKLCLSAGKHVLCEKPLTLNAREAAECIELARDKQLFLMEAIWMRFNPALAQLKAWVDEGRLGEIRQVEADFWFHREFDPEHRLFNPALGGGALLDVGIYPLAFTTLLLGFPQSAVGYAQVGETGVDEVNNMLLRYGSRTTARLGSSVSVNKPQTALVVGTKGFVEVHAPFYCADTLTLHEEYQPPVTHSIPYQGNGYPHEVMEVHHCLRQGWTESPQLPLDHSLRMMELMDALRRDWGVRYPADDAPT